MDYKNKTILITGASTGIGKAIALAFKEKGADIIILGLHKPDYDCTFFECDLSSIDHIQEVLANIPKIDVLVNNAGIAIFENIEQTSEENFDKVMDVNFKSLFFMCKYSVPKIPSGGSIINIASVAGYGGATEGNGVVYYASKAAVINLTKSLASELGAKGIRANAISPGVIETPIFEKALGEDGKTIIEQYGNQTPAKRAGTPEEVAHAAIFLVENTYTNAASITVDGGMMAV